MRAAKATKPATLTVVTLGARNASDVTAGRATTETAVRCRGLLVSASGARFLGTEVQVGDRVVHLIATTLKGHAPKIGDKITIESVTSRVIAIGPGDAATALHVCLVRG